MKKKKRNNNIYGWIYAILAYFFVSILYFVVSTVYANDMKPVAAVLDQYSDYNEYNELMMRHLLACDLPFLNEWMKQQIGIINRPSAKVQNKKRNINSFIIARRIHCHRFKIQAFIVFIFNFRFFQRNSSWTIQSCRTTFRRPIYRTKNSTNTAFERQP